jgi:hypothetical protein
VGPLAAAPPPALPDVPAAAAAFMPAAPALDVAAPPLPAAAAVLAPALPLAVADAPAPPAAELGVVVAAFAPAVPAAVAVGALVPAAAVVVLGVVAVLELPAVGVVTPEVCESVSPPPQAAAVSAAETIQANLARALALGARVHGSNAFNIMALSLEMRREAVARSRG